MASILIKNVGPLKDTGIVELSQFNVLIGKQSSGKSTFMKILCFCQWLEKQIMTGNDKELVYNYTHYHHFVKDLMRFHRLNENFFSNRSEIHFKGEAITIDLIDIKKNARISRNPNFEDVRHNVKLCFIPSERNLVSAIRNIDRAYRTKDNDILFNHIFEWSDAKEYASEQKPIKLNVVGQMAYFYDAKNGKDWIKLNDQGRPISPFYASSGVQSVLPVVVMTEYFTSSELYDTVDTSKYDIAELFRKITGSINEKATIERLAEKVSRTFKYKNTKLFIEEPEQNLFPESQQALINYLVARINLATEHTKEQSSLTITTHSPYIITAFNVLIRAYQAAAIDSEKTDKIVPCNAHIPLKNITAYYIGTEGNFKNIIDNEIEMISGIELDNASEIVEKKLTLLNDVIYE